MLPLLLLSITLAYAGSVPFQFPKVVEFSIHKTRKHGPDLVKAAGSLHLPVGSVSLDNEQYYYQIQLEIGNPPQKADFTIDTGSSDLWVMSDKNPYCTDDPSNITGINCTDSVFHPELSHTYERLTTPFNIVYGDRTMANGTLGRDTLRLGDGLTVSNATFALADVVNSSTCVFGVGFIGNEANARVYNNGSGVFPTYFNVPTLMKEQELISTNAYSLWLNDVEAESGSILFGGIDRAKYEGNLWVLPVYNNYHKYTDRPIQTRVMLNSVTADGLPLADFQIPVLLDSGTSFAYLPPPIVHAMGSALGFIYDELLGYYFGSFEQALSNVQNFYLSFSGAIIEIPVRNLLISITEEDSETPIKVNDQAQSILAIGLAEDDYMYILGDVFLRSIYTVFDIDHYEIAIANAKMNATDSDIVTIGASIPGAIQAPSYTRTRASNTSIDLHSFSPATPVPEALTVSFGNFTAVATPSATTTLELAFP